MNLGSGVTVTVRQPTPPRFVVQAPTVARTVALPVRGPQGPAGTATAITHVQAAPAATWTIPHGLGRAPAFVAVYVSGELVDTDTHVDATNVVLTFATPTAGTAQIL